MPGMVRVEARRCSVHGAKCLMVVGPDGNGTRLTAGKCCGSWDVLMGAWHVDPAEVYRDMVDIMAETTTGETNEPTAT